MFGFKPLYICMYVCVYVCMFVCMCMHGDIDVYVCMCGWSMYIRVYICVYVFVSVLVYLRICVLPVCVSSEKRIHKHKYN